MSEITIDFTFRFDHEETAKYVRVGFGLIHEGKFGKAKKHFAQQEADFGVTDKGAACHFQFLYRDDAYLTGFAFGGTVSFDEEKFLAEVERLGATHILAQIDNSQVGEGYSVARRNGKEVKPATALKDFAAENPTFGLAVAIDKGKKKEALKFIEEGKANLNGTLGGSAFLPLAIHEGLQPVAEALIDAGADPDGVMAPPEGEYESGGETALYKAVEEGSKKLVKLLLAAGADPNKVSGEGRTPLHLAIGNLNYYSFARLLVEHGATINEPPDNNGQSPFIEFLANASASQEAVADEEDRKSGVEGLKLFDYMIKKGASLDDTFGGGNVVWFAGGHSGILTRLASLGHEKVVAPEFAYRKGEAEHNLKTALNHRDWDRFETELGNAGNIGGGELAQILWSAMLSYHRHAIRGLVEAGADPNRRFPHDKPLYQYFADLFPEDQELIDYLKEKASPGIAQEKKRLDRALNDYHKFEKWFATLRDRDEEKATCEPYYGEWYRERKVKYRDQHIFDRMKTLATDTRGEMFPEVGGSENKIYIVRTFWVKEQEQACRFYLEEAEGRFVITDTDIYFNS